jgi:hypothetical protein
MNTKLNHPSRFTFHVSRIISAFCFLLSVFPLPAQVWITNSLTISETNAAYDGQDLVISGPGVTVAMDGPHHFNSLLLTNSAILTHSPCTASAIHRLDLFATNSLAVSSTSWIDVSGLGYVAGYSKGNVTGGAASGQSGGSYGGLGGNSSGNANVVYGDYREADEWGEWRRHGRLLGGDFGGRAGAVGGGELADGRQAVGQRGR